MQKQGQFLLFTREEFKDWLFRTEFKREIKTIQQHHTYIPNYSHFHGDNHFELLDGMKNAHLSRGFSDIAQSITTFKDGMISICRSFEKDPAGIKGQNRGDICIENLVNLDVEHLTEEHKETIIYITALLCIKFGILPSTSNILYHHWFDLNTGKRTDSGSHKTCPGVNFFGGNKVIDAAKNFIPLIKQEIAEIKGIAHTTPSRSNVNREIYRVRKLWSDEESQIGAYGVLENAKDLANVKAKEGYKVFNSKGEVVYSPSDIVTIQPIQKIIVPKPVIIPKLNRILKLGDRGSDVKLIQEKLNQAMNTNIQTDSVYGKRTEGLVKAFQKKHKLVPDGVIGIKTFTELWK